jgi:hypothetical protein
MKIAISYQPSAVSYHQLKAAEGRRLKAEGYS